MIDSYFQVKKKYCEIYGNETVVIIKNGKDCKIYGNKTERDYMKNISSMLDRICILTDSISPEHTIGFSQEKLASYSQKLIEMGKVVVTIHSNGEKSIEIPLVDDV